ncbi:hypothetical protein R16034_02840 [Ralstonia edaphis]|uniref:Uncharacterized protein n=2 Tax=Burkholderiaceae TaxID=119060 RepID=A0AB72X369_9RALS|nr:MULTISPECIES: hypothetical protein [unclassified Ralstonia]TXD57269.1 hypothetical protein FUT88_16620 [Ralstonia sp. TCR112]CAJ0741828.1 hypothetical protein R16034_02840 [Ralstonia sp. LMG 6871]
MPQNLISYQLTSADLAAVDGALKTLEDRLASLIDLTPVQRRTLVKMGDKSEAFARKAVEVLNTNPNLLPGNFDLAELRRDLAGFDQLRSRLMRVARIHERMADSQLALGSDVMSATLEGYAFLKVAGQGEGLDAARKALAVRFSRGAKRKDDEAGRADERSSDEEQQAELS